MPFPAIWSKVCQSACMTSTKSTIRKVAIKGDKNDFSMYLSKIFIQYFSLKNTNQLYNFVAGIFACQK